LHFQSPFSLNVNVYYQERVYRIPEDIARKKCIFFRKINDLFGSIFLVSGNGGLSAFYSGHPSSRTNFPPFAKIEIIGFLSIE
jgi:hypothetical protein